MRNTVTQRIINVALVFIGSLALVLGIIGIFLPILPTTPFLLLSAACYIRGSNRLYNWLIQNRVFGKYIKNYREGKGIPLKTKVWALVFLWGTISSSIIFFIPLLLVKVLLFLIAVGVTIHILSIRTLV